MEWSETDLELAVARLLPATEYEAAMALLHTYGAEPYEREVQRVRRVIVQTCHGSADKLRKLVAVAKGDYRDVLIGDRGRDGTYK